MNVNPWNGSRIKGDPRRKMTRLECVEGRHWLHVVQQAASGLRNSLLPGHDGKGRWPIGGVVADLDLMINTLSGYRRYLAGEGWAAPGGAELPPWNPIKSHAEGDERQRDPGSAL